VKERGLRAQHVIQFELSDIAQLLWQRKWIWICAGLLGGLLALTIALALPRKYTALSEFVVRAGEATVAPDPERAFHSAVVSEAIVSTERQVLTSRGLLARVAGAVNMPPELEQPGGIAGLIHDWAVALQDDLEHGAAPVAEIAHWFGLQDFIADLASPSSAAAIGGRRFGVVADAVTVNATKNSSVISAQATTVDPQLSADIINQLLKFYMEERLVSQQRIVQNAEAGLRERLRQTRAEISASEERVAMMAQQPGLLEGTEVPSGQRDLALLGSRLSEARVELVKRQAAYDAAANLRDAARGDPTRLVELLDQGAQSTADLRQRYTERKAELDRLSSTKGPRHPDRLAVEQQLEGLRRTLAAEARRVVEQRRSEMEGAKQAVTEIASQYEALRTRAAQRSPETLNMDREREALASMRRVAATIEDRLIELAARPFDPNARILTYASVPARAASPSKSVFTLAGVFLGSLGSALAMIISGYMKRLRPSVVTQAQYLTAPLLGAIPHFGSGERARRKVLAAVLSRGEPEALLAAVAFHGVATEVDEAAHRNDFRTLAVTSGASGEGKSTVAVGLALALASVGQRVLLIDCDLHGQRFDGLGVTVADPKPGEGDDFSRDIWVDPASGLHVLSLSKRAQATPPLYYLRSGDFRSVMVTARSRYDLVLCDTPPILAVPDALLVAKRADAVLLVAAHRRQDEAEAEEISRRISVAGKPVCGVVMNKVVDKGAIFASYSGYDRVGGSAGLILTADR
jgi:succinoglycan biosynthesis transport protein ExoP